YFFGQKYYPINYPLRDIAFYVVLAVALFAAMTWGNAHLGTWLSLGVNTLLLGLYLAVVVWKDFRGIIRRRKAA
ncbi:MAG: lipopolysaccharide biosynthesis protein, partial [Prevotella sp.]|nr:lipopolysaccharide biosynthesis protein [Prevotella sp.]